MADDYDPSDPPTFDGADSYDPSHVEYSDAQQDMAVDEDDDYDPLSFHDGGDGATENDTPNTEGTPQRQASQNTQSKPRTIGGFMVEESDDEQGEAGVPPSQPNGSDGAQSGLGTAVRSETQGISLHSAPQDTAASSISLNGSNTIPPPSTSTPIPPTSLSRPLSAVQGKNISPAPNNPFANPSMAQNAPSASQGPTRLPHDKVGHLEDRIKDDPKGDTDAWLRLISHYYDKGQYDFARSVYQRFLEVFPSASTIWVNYLRMESELDDREKIEGIFTQCLLQLTSVKMCSLYLDHLRRIMPLMNDTSGQLRGTIISAFDLVLEQVGIDPDSGGLWREYIDFIRDGPGMVKPASEKDATTWQDSQKMDSLRKAYQRAFRHPHSELMKMWKEYEAFEMGIHKGTGRKNMSEQSPHYMQARAASKQLELKLEGLDRQSIPRLPPLYGHNGEDEFATQVEKWRDWIAWEKEDPLLFKGEDDAEFRKRVLYAYKQAVKQLAFYPPIWFEAASWCFAQGTEDLMTQGEQFLDKAMVSNPESVLLAMAKADRIESRLETGNTDEVLIRNGEKLEEPYEHVHSALYALRKKMQEKEQKVVAQIHEYFASLPPEDESPDDSDEADEDEQAKNKPPTREEQLKARLQESKAAADAQMEIVKHTISYVWVAKMRAFRRIQGQGMPQKKNESTKPTVKGFRGIFSDARPRGALTSDVYIASALMEWHCYRDPSAIKIFERGMKLFPTDEMFILEYIKHLIAENDITNARVVFESTIPKIQGSSKFPIQKQRQKCRVLFSYMHEFESKYGDLAQVHKIERRMAELYPDEPEISRLSHRLALPTFDAIGEQLMLSPTQAQPKPTNPLDMVPAQAAISIEQAQSPKGLEILLGPNGPYVASPKRPLDDSDSEAPQRKFLRAESPMKGGAGVRVQTKPNTGGGGFATKTYIPPGAPGAAGFPLPPSIDAILRLLPNTSSYSNANVRFDPAKFAAFLVTTNVEHARALHNVGQLNMR